jgi:NAD(P)-dependent dehydrogenase (short-subunit alcohol dehydrogenase family)
MNRTAAVVSGSTGAIGAAITKSLAEKGFRVWCGYHRSEEKARSLAREFGGDSLRLSSEGGEVEALAEVFASGPAGVVLVNASGVNVEGHCLALGDGEWNGVFDVNLFWAIRLSRAAVRLMLPRGGGRIIHLSSAAARTGGRGQLNYAAAKAALERVVKGFAQECGPRGILINAVAPGIVESPMAERVIEKYGPELLKWVAMRRFGRPEEVA